MPWISPYKIDVCAISAVIFKDLRNNWLYPKIRLVCIFQVLPRPKSMRGFLLALGLVLLKGISPGIAHHQDATWLMWKQFKYTFDSTTVNQCISRATSALARNGFSSDMGSESNDKGTYGYAYGWTKDNKTTAVITCEYDDKESNLMFSHYGRSIDKVEHLFDRLDKGKW